MGRFSFQQRDPIDGFPWLLDESDRSVDGIIKDIEVPWPIRLCLRIIGCPQWPGKDERDFLLSQASMGAEGRVSQGGKIMVLRRGADHRGGVGQDSQIPDAVGRKLEFLHRFFPVEDLLDPLRVRSDYSPCDPDDLTRLTAEVLDDEEWTMPEGNTTQHSS